MADFGLGAEKTLKRKNMKKRKEGKKKENKNEKRRNIKEERKMTTSGDSIKQHLWTLALATGSVHSCCLSEWLPKVLHQSPLLPVAMAQIESKNTSKTDGQKNLVQNLKSRASDSTTRVVCLSVC